jgi:hypothetical protein
MTQEELVEKVTVDLLKHAGAAESTIALGGRLYMSKSGWLLLTVPNAFIRSLYASLNELGVELPTKDTNDPASPVNAHISVMNADEVAAIGGPDVITERGKVYHYQLGKVKTTTPDGWDGVSKVWFVEVYSPELQTLRKSYGLSPLPRYPFHITFAIRKRNVLRDNEIRKGTNGEVSSETGS